MELQNRMDLLKESKMTRKLDQIQENIEEFQQLIDEEVEKLPTKKPFETSDDKSNDIPDNLESEMVVCVRVRPRLEHEVATNYITSTYPSNPEVLVVEPGFKFGTKPKPKLTSNRFKVDLVFGEEDDNSTVYSNVAGPVLDLALKGGVGSVLAYGQTGSGKTFTISGLLERLGKDLFAAGDKVNLHLSYFELLGNKAKDLLDHDSEVDIREDKFGNVNVTGVKEVKIEGAGQFRELTETAVSHRLTQTTMKNDTSSRSHAICRIRVENLEVREADDGFLFIIDLAGSENAADSQFHDKDRIKETQQINTSLMALKECIRGRALSAEDPTSLVHIPYRQSKLTLLLKEVFELESHKLSRTVVFANVAPSIVDNAMTLNTLRYVNDIKKGVKNRKRIEADPNNPKNWTNVEMKAWIKGKSNGKIDPETLCPWESGRQLLTIPEADFITRIVQNNHKLSEKKAKEFYGLLWTALIDAQTKERKQKTKKAKKISMSEYGEPAPEPVPEPETRKTVLLEFKINGPLALSWDTVQVHDIIQEIGGLECTERPWICSLLKLKKESVVQARVVEESFDKMTEEKKEMMLKRMIAEMKIIEDQNEQKNYVKAELELNRG